MSDDLTPAGEFVRERYATPDSERSPDDPLRNPDGWVPCAREHEPGRVCIRPDGHDRRRPDCDTCGDTGLVDWMIESDPNLYQEPDADGKLPCPDCDPTRGLDPESRHR